MDRPPNILLVISDDHAAWALHDNPLGVPTPNLDRLRDQGTRFTEAFTPCPVCSPARACLMTGKMPSEVGIHDWLDETREDVATRDWLNGVPTLPEKLKATGYQTFLSGKWHLGSPCRNPAGVDHAFCMSPWIRSHHGEEEYYLDGEELRLNGNRSQLITDQALRFLDQADPDLPFFLNVGYFATHSPYVETAHQVKEGAPYLDHAFPDMPRGPAHPEARNENGPHPEHPQEEERRSRWRGYSTGVAEIDEGLGRMLEKLDERGQLENTVIMYTSDHGCCLGHHGIWGKGNGTRPVNFTDTSIRIPMLMMGPGIEKGIGDSGLTTHLESHQRLLHAAGLMSEAPEPRSCVVGEYGDARMIRTGEWKWIDYHDQGSPRLFHLSEDPEETQNLTTEHAPFAEVTESLSHQLQEEFAPFHHSNVNGHRILELPVHNAHEPWATRRTPQGITS